MLLLLLFRLLLNLLLSNLVLLLHRELLFWLQYQLLLFLISLLCLQELNRTSSGACTGAIQAVRREKKRRRLHFLHSPKKNDAAADAAAAIQPTLPDSNAASTTYTRYLSGPKQNPHLRPC